MTLESTGEFVRGSDAIARRIRELAPWFHNLHLPGGHETAPDHPLGDFPAFKWRSIAPALPRDLSGWRALDVGCNAGFYSFELARRGAEVTGIDSDDRYLEQARWAAEQFELEGSVRFVRLSVYELARRGGRYDLVLFMGVLYHLRYPLLALDALAEKTRRLLVLQTLTMPGARPLATPADLPLDSRAEMLEPGWPVMAFVERRLAGDPTNWWAPNDACAEAMLRSSGLRVVARPHDETWVCEPAPRTLRITAELDAASGRV